MAQIEKLCSTEEYTKYFKDIQRLGKFDLFQRFDDIESIVNRKIDEKHRHFLATPVVESDSITWFSKPYSETPQRLSELQDDERSKYERIKNETLHHYKNVAHSLRNEGKSSEADALENATKFVNDDFVYCFDNKTVLGVWGMQLRDNVREPLGVAMKNMFVKKKRLQPQPEIATEPPAIDNPPELPQEPPPDPFTVRFNAGEGGNLNGASEYAKYDGDIVTEGEVPQVEPKEGYEFTGWDKNPNNHTVTGDTEFMAQYRKIPPVVPVVPWWKGCLRWLLLLLLLGLIFMVIWCCLLKRCNFNFCGCGEEVAVETPDVTPPSPDPPTPPPSPDPPTPPPSPDPPTPPAPPDPIKPDGPIPSTGDVEITLHWNDYNDLDLHCVDPDGNRIWYSNKTVPSRGQLEIDMNASPDSNTPIEHIYWPIGGAPYGTYKVYLVYYAQYDTTENTPYTIRVKYGSTIEEYEGIIKWGDPDIHICTFTYTN